MIEYRTVKLPFHYVRDAEIITQRNGWVSTADMVRHALRRYMEEELRVLLAEAKKSDKTDRSHKILKEFREHRLPS